LRIKVRSHRHASRISTNVQRADRRSRAKDFRAALNSMLWPFFGTGCLVTCSCQSYPVGILLQYQPPFRTASTCYPPTNPLLCSDGARGYYDNPQPLDVLDWVLCTPVMFCHSLFQPFLNLAYTKHATFVPSKRHIAIISVNSAYIISYTVSSKSLLFCSQRISDYRGLSTS
jgi:hypothetical protein